MTQKELAESDKDYLDDVDLSKGTVTPVATNELTASVWRLFRFYMVDNSLITYTYYNNGTGEEVTKVIPFDDLRR